MEFSNFGLWLVDIHDARNHACEIVLRPFYRALIVIGAIVWAVGGEGEFARSAPIPDAHFGAKFGEVSGGIVEHIPILHTSPDENPMLATTGFHNISVADLNRRASNFRLGADEGNHGGFGISIAKIGGQLARLSSPIDANKSILGWSVAAVPPYRLQSPSGNATGYGEWNDQIKPIPIHESSISDRVLFGGINDGAPSVIEGTKQPQEAGDGGPKRPLCPNCAIFPSLSRMPFGAKLAFVSAIWIIAWGAIFEGLGFNRPLYRYSRYRGLPWIVGGLTIGLIPLLLGVL